MMEQPRKPQEWGPSVGSPQPALLYDPQTRDPGQSQAVRSPEAVPWGSGGLC